jgi:hypothetical protein
MPITIDGTNGITQAGEFNSDSSFGFKNRIINGAMTIDQRNAGASITPTNGQFSVDRFQQLASQSSKYTAQQNAGSVTPPNGFNNYLGITSSSAYSVTSSDYFAVRHIIEGFNVADFNWGTATAKTVTLSFWVRSSLTGTFGGALTNDDNTRSYPFSYTINAANTWEFETITIAGDTTGTWLKTNGRGVQVRFGFGVGSTQSGTAGAWAAGDFISATGATSVVGTNGATFYITGVQLEVGSTATSFDYRPYTTELQLCQRYLPAFIYPASGNLGLGYTFFANTLTVPVRFPVSTRTTPTSVTVSSGSIFTWFNNGGGNGTSTAVSWNNGSTEQGSIALSVTLGVNQTALVNFNAAGYLLFNGCEL